MHGRIITLGLVLGFFISGCSDSRYVTRAEFDAWKAAQEAAELADVSGARHEAAVTGLYASLQGIKQAIAMTSENLTNAETTGYKALRVEFIHDGAEARGVSDFAIGAPVYTGGDFDLMIQGEGFFTVRHPGQPHGIAYTRAGNFYRNIDGDLVLGGADGPRLEPMINIPEGVTGIQISEDGVLRGITPGSVAPVEFGRIELASFMNPRGLQRLSGSLFIETQSSGAPVYGMPGEAAMGTLMQKFLERSNVSSDMEMARLTTLNWRYEEVRHAIQMLGESRAAR